MQFGGIQRFSSIDFPGKLSAVVFTMGCNFRCPFCHNPELVLGESRAISEEKILAFLHSRVHQLDAVVISGGEPTLHSDLPEFISKVKDLGFLVKLDTNGTRPKVLKKLLEAKMLDFVAMDLKHTWDRYAFAVGAQVTKDDISASIEMLLKDSVDYEFRTTLIRDFHTLEDVVKMSEMIPGAKKYVVQGFIPNKTLDKDFSKKLPFDREELEALRARVQKNVLEFQIRQ